MTDRSVTTYSQALKVIGLQRSQFRGLRFYSAGMGVDTWCVTLAKNVRGLGRKGDEQLYPVPHAKVVINGKQ